ncbi:RNA polymerase sigma-70 factor, ECF subfamily [Pseudarcicella hirudinis]|uniref:RNA polymerase sigma-70 factor, ECF subfamily n=2 Tax=Pseudarcicella hirudinis TaxID=1079859 RepID=A0A1I5YMR7_9BACT|nr:RNA polymerase sigma-70 factor, ECF subfamily [Pseudarcicella hirudinis]
MDHLSDNTLMLKVKAGDLDKMGLLFERYHRSLYGFLFHMTNQKEASEDMVQNVFYRMLKYRNSFSGDGAFRTWMYHLARNVLKDYVKSNNRSAFQYDLKEIEERISGGSTADQLLEKEQELQALETALAGLSAENKELLVLSRYQELSYQEIAQILDTTEGAIKVRVHRAMNQLKSIYLKINV